MKRSVLSIAMGILLAMATAASAATFDLYGLGSLVNRDGIVSNPANIFNFSSLSLKPVFTTAGSHSAFLLLDAEIDQGLNTFYNEVGSAHGLLGAGQSWQIGDPMVSGGVYDLTAAGALTNSDLNLGLANDVALALGYNFTLTGSQMASLDFYLSGTKPTSGFYLEQYDPESDVSLYFNSKLTITDKNPVPEPSTLLLLAAGVGGIAIFRRRFPRS